MKEVIRWSDGQVDDLLAAIGMEGILTEIEEERTAEEVFPGLSSDKARMVYRPLRRAVERFGVDEVLDGIINMHGSRN